MKKLLLVASLFLGATPALHAQQQPATVIIVRHAEKAAEPAGDPPLSPMGRERAEALLLAVQDAGVNVIYTTPKVRTMETAQFVANALQIPIIEVPIESGKIDAHIADMVRRVKMQGGGRVSLIVSHSNVMPALIKALGGGFVGDIADDRYDDIFILTLQDGKPPRLLKLKYGRRSP